MKIICVNGYARSGKDSFCDAIFYNRGLVYPFSTIDEIKKVALQFGWDGKKDAKGRKLLSDLKDCLTEYDNLPTKYIIEQIKVRLDIIQEKEIYNNVIFLVQMREPKEIKYWKENYGAKALLITRPNSEKEWGNHADDEVLNAEYDYVLENISDLKTWEMKSIEFIDEVRKEEWESHV